jgi:hypothetical protein
VADNDVPPQENPLDVEPKGGVWGRTFNSSGLTDEVRAILSGYRWVTTNGGKTSPTAITYYFPTTVDDYLSNPSYYAPNAVANFEQVTPSQQAAVLSAFALISSYTGLQFQLAASGSGANAALRFSRDTVGGGSSAFYPYPGTNSAGDNYLGGNAFTVDQYFGTDAFASIIHELGHVLTGGPGDDLFAFARGDGNDIVHASSIDGNDTVAFDAGVAHDQLWFAQSSDDLVVSVIGENQSITVAGWFASTDNQFGQFSAGDSFAVTAAAVDRLVQAMAAFSPPPIGQTTLPTDLANSLAPTLATNWQHS